MREFGPYTILQGSSEVVAASWKKERERQGNSAIQSHTWRVAEGDQVTIVDSGLTNDVTKALVRFEGSGHVMLVLTVALANGAIMPALFHYYVAPVPNG